LTFHGRIPRHGGPYGQASFPKLSFDKLVRAARMTEKRTLAITRGQQTASKRFLDLAPMRCRNDELDQLSRNDTDRSCETVPCSETITNALVFRRGEVWPGLFLVVGGIGETPLGTKRVHRLHDRDRLIERHNLALGLAGVQRFIHGDRLVLVA